MLTCEIVNVIERSRIVVIVRRPDAGVDFDAVAIIEPLRRFAVVQIEANPSPRPWVEFQRELLAVR